MKIAGELTIKDWEDLEKKLVLNNDELWGLAFHFFEERIRTRYLNPINAILDLKINNGEGFAVVNLQCSLIETIESFINGWKYEHPHYIKMDGDSFKGNKNVFMSFFKNHNAFKIMESKAYDFYINVRCACLHETQTKNGWTILSDTEQTKLVFNGEKIIFRENFQKELENIIAKYKLAIQIGTSYKNIAQAINTGNSFENLEKNTELRDNFKAKMKHICDKS
ncbi:hypothetical protein C3L50_06515 [Flavobacterium alvei]|uniref:Uncharacterized protein n=1 Tax=Flavobacterium alvei TaxID=2080416 RepID=A0A2S5ACL0_9FLAO|nr:hypothetical protein [Flavobacterium alvei]POY40294.1 hypothetical protein C3L50_06515 [Flavobacterium alvei]